MSTHTVTPEQARLLAQFMAARDHAERELAIAVNAMTAGILPEGAHITNVDTDTGALTWVARAG